MVTLKRPHRTTPPAAAREPELQPRLNIFALPSRTGILFFLIAAVILVPVLAMLVEDTPLWEPFVIFWMLVLPVRSFLRRPQHEPARWRMQELALVDSDLAV